MEPTSIQKIKAEANEISTEHIETRQSVTEEYGWENDVQFQKMNQLREGERFYFEEDSAKLGKKKIWKTDRYDRLYNKRIDQSRKLTSKATADTLVLYEKMMERKQKKLDNFRQIRDQEMAPWDQQKERALKRIDYFKSMRLEKRMLTTAYVRTHFSELMDIVESYNEIKVLAKREEAEVAGEQKDILDRYNNHQDHKIMLEELKKWEAKMDQMNTYKLWLRDRINEISGPFDILTERMERYLARNRLDMNGNILDDNVKTRPFAYNNNVDREFGSIASQIQEKTVKIHDYNPEQLYNGREELLVKIVNYNGSYISELEAVLKDEKFEVKQVESANYTGFFNMNSVDRVKNIIPMRKNVKDINDTITLFENRLKELSNEKEGDPLERSRQIKGIEEELSRAKRQCILVKTILALAEKEGKLLLLKNDDEKKAVLGEIEGLWKDYERCKQCLIKEHQPLTGTRGMKDGIEKISDFEAMDSDTDFANQILKNHIWDVGNKLKNIFPELGNTAVLYGTTTHYNDEPKVEVERLKDIIKEREKIFTDNAYEKELLAELDGYLNQLLEESRDIQNSRETSFVDKSYFDEYLLNARGEISDFDMVKDEENSKTQQGSIMNAALKDKIIWEEIGVDTPIIAHKPTINDLRQTKSTMSYITAATTGLINFKSELINNCIRDNKDGTVTVRLYEPPKTVGGECKPKYIRILKRVPMLKTGEALFTDGPYWMKLIERAAAAVGMFREGRQGYQSLEYGRGDEWITILTGATGGTLFDRDIYLKDKEDKKKNVIENEDSKKKQMEKEKEEEKQFRDAIYEKLKDAAKDNCIYHAATKENANDKISGHAFTVLGVKEEGNGEQKQRFVILRNPYFNISRTVTDSGKIADAKTNSNATVDDTYGQFNMPFDLFMETMQTISYSDMTNVIPREEKYDK